MIIALFKRISPYKFLCATVAVGLVFVAACVSILSQVQAQTAPAAATVHVDVTP